MLSKQIVLHNLQNAKKSCNFPSQLTIVRTITAALLCEQLSKTFLSNDIQFTGSLKESNIKILSKEAESQNVFTICVII